MKRKTSKAEAILDSIRNAEVTDNVIIHNKDGSIWCILQVICKEHKEEN